MSNVSFMNVDSVKENANKVFEEQKQRILKLLPSADIQHIGSTAIPGSVTKGDLDINVRVVKKDFEIAKEMLKQLYQINQPENWTEEFASFKDDSTLGIDFGAQLTIIGSKTDDFVKLRDMLINNPQLVKDYNQMKLKYNNQDMDSYRKEKSDFFEKLRRIITPKNVVIGKGSLAGKGVYADRNFKKGEIIIHYNLKQLTEEEYNSLPSSEKMFTHTHWGVIRLYSEPERYVNHSKNPNTYQDLEKKCDIALRDIKKGEAITTDATKDDVL